MRVNEKIIGKTLVTADKTSDVSIQIKVVQLERRHANQASESSTERLRLHALTLILIITMF